MQTDLQIVASKAEPDRKSNKFADMLCKDLEGIIEKIKKILKVFEKMLRAEIKDKKVLKGLVNDTEAVDKEVEESLNWGKTFGYDANAEKPKKRKRKATA